jgi:hypothetical protein
MDYTQKCMVQQANVPEKSNLKLLKPLALSAAAKPGS